MEALPVRPQPPAAKPPAPKPQAAKAHAKAAHPGAAHATSTATTLNPEMKAPAHDADADDLALLMKQRGFDDMVRIRAELEREANALRDLALAQVKRDDQAMQAWIKLI